MTIHGDVVYEDQISKKLKTNTELFALFIGLFLMLAVTFQLPMVYKIIMLPGIVGFIVVFYKKGSGINYDSRFRIFDDGVEAVKEKRFYAWNELDKIEIIPGTIGTRATPTYIAFIQGNNVVAIATNLKKNEIENIKGLFQRYGVKIAVKQ